MYTRERSEQPAVSVIVVSHNARPLLRDCLLSVKAAQGPRHFEVVVADNASSDGSLEMCRDEFPDVQTIENHENLGFGMANNQGIRASRAELVLLLNSDTVVSAESVNRLIEQILCRPGVGVLGCRAIRPDGSEQPSCFNFPSLKTAIVERLLLYGLSRKLPHTVMEYHATDGPFECDWVLGACMLVRRAALEAVGGFDESIWMYGEEMDLCYRIKAAGWKIMFDPHAEIIRLGGGSWGKRACSPTVLKVLGLLYFFVKYRSWGIASLVRILIAAGAILRIFVWMTALVGKRDERKSIFGELRANLLILRSGVGLRKSVTAGRGHFLNAKLTRRRPPDSSASLRPWV